MASEWIIVAVIGVILLLSAKKLPDMARGLGQSMRIFKAETRGMREDDQRSSTAERPAVGGTAPGRAADDPTSHHPPAGSTVDPAVTPAPESRSGGGSPAA